MALAPARHSFPFTAIVGQERMKLALLLNAVHPGIGGVLIRGERGTGKSTAVRALARLLPPQRIADVIDKLRQFRRHPSRRPPRHPARVRPRWLLALPPTRTVRFTYTSNPPTSSC